MPLNFKITGDDFSDFKGTSSDLIKGAAVSAMRKFANAAQRLGKADVRTALGSRMASFFRVDAWPKDGQESINAAAQMDFFTKYSEIFETGGTITPAAKRLLWVPLPGAPRGPKGKHIGPKDLKVPLFYHRPKAGKHPLLATDVFATGSVNASSFKTASQLRKASVFTKSRKLRKPKNPLAQRITVPLFFGIQRVVLKARTRLYAIFAQEQVNLEGYYNDARAQQGDD